LYLISQQADLSSVTNDGRSVLELYGLQTTISEQVKEQHRAILLDAWVHGPHPSQRWARRWPFMQVMVFNDFQPLLARQLILLTLNPPLPPDASIPPVIISTVAQRRAFLNMAVFGHGYLWRIIASYI
jgi:hypothetical protein